MTDVIREKTREYFGFGTKRMKEIKEMKKSMNLRKTILPLLICFSLILTSFGTVFATEVTQELQTDESGTYLIGTADELFAFAKLAKATAEADNTSGSTRTVLSAKLTANINLNPGTTFTYDHETGLVTVAKGEESYKMGSGMKDTELGNFHPVYNGLCTWEQWNDESKTQEQLDEYRNTLIEQMNEKVEALGLKKWTPIGTKALPYIGYFDGNGYMIDGLYINDNTVYYTGLFGVTGNYAYISGTSDYGEVKNITIGEHSLIVGYGAYTSGATGAIVGMTQFDKITGCANYATVVAKGSENLTLSNSGLVGGIVGYANNDVKNCTNHGTVVSRESAGGIVGNIMGNQYQQGNIIYCSNYGKVYAEAHSDTGYAGGIAINSGDYKNNAAGCGGNVESCVNYGYVEGYYVGGVIYRGSQNTQVKYCANRGEVKGTSFASGIITYINNGGFTMEGCFNAGTVKALPYEGNGTVTPRVFPLVASVYTTDYYTVKNCYNDETVCPSDGAIFREGVTASNSYGVTTEFFATGELAYKMGSYDKKGWKQNIATPTEDGKTPEAYPTTDGTRRVYENTHYCCHTDDTNKQAHKQVFYSNAYGDITDEHTPNESGICTHCGTDVRKPIFLLDTLPEAKVGKSYSVTIRLSDSVPIAKGHIEATVSDADDTSYTFSHGLTGTAEYSYSSKYYYTISGIPTEAGELTFTLSATNENGTTKKTYTLKINEADSLEIDTEAKLDNGTVGESYSQTLQCYSTDLEKTWTIAEGSVLPAGLTLSEDGTIYGTPTMEGDYSFTIVLTAGGQTTKKTFTLKIFDEGGCKHNNMVKIPGTPATCKKDGITDYYHCNICELDFLDEAGTNELYNKDDLKIASNHTDKDSDGKCDFCGKNMPIFKKVTSNDGIVYGGTYILVTEIDGKYYALTIPPEGKSGREYTEFMNLCEITKKADGSFDFNEIENKNAIMLKTEFAAEGGDLDAGTPRYGLSSVFDGKRYGLSDGGANFYAYANEPAKYGYRITMNTSGAALIGSVYQSWWSTPETADNGLLRAFDMTYNEENTKFMSLYAEDYYNGKNGTYSGATMTDYPIYLYRMSDVGTTSSGITFISNDSNGTVDRSAVEEILNLTDDANLSNVSGISNAVNQTVVETVIEAAENVSESVSVRICADITATAATTETDEKENKTPTSVTYSVMPKITVTSEDGNVLSTSTISDSDLNGVPIMVTLYTGGIYPEQIIHYKNDSTKEYFYSEGSEKAQNGAKSFEYENGFVTFTITDFSDIKILKTAEQEEIFGNNLSYDGKTLTATVDKDGSYTVVFAGYEKDGRLSYLTTSVQNFKVGTNTAEIPKDVDISAVNKIFLWKDLTSLQPVCGALDITLK